MLLEVGEEEALSCLHLAFEDDSVEAPAEPEREKAGSNLILAVLGGPRNTWDPWEEGEWGKEGNQDTLDSQRLGSGFLV